MTIVSYMHLCLTFADIYITVQDITVSYCDTFHVAAKLFWLKLTLDAERFCHRHRHRHPFFSRDTLVQRTAGPILSVVTGVPNWSMTLRPVSQYREGKQCARPAGLAPVSKLESKSVFKTLTGPSSICPSHDA